MELQTIPYDQTLLCVTADRFPEGIREAFDELKRRIPANDQRTPFGISKPEQNGSIVFRAGVVEAFAGEAHSCGCETIMLRKGTYIVETITGWQSKIDSISAIFESLLLHPNLDPETPCIEVYQSQTELKCMVRIIPIQP